MSTFTTKKTGRLRDLQLERFCREYVANGHNGTKAAISVGKNKASAAWWASEQLKIPKVFQRVLQLEEDIIDSLILSKEEVVAEMNKLAVFDPRMAYDEEGNLLHPKDMDEITAANIKEVTVINGKVVGVKFLDNKRGAIQDMMKYYNAFEDHQKSKVADVHIHFDDKDRDA